ncbi:retrovirus-related pol polyprotein from transposon TNT 1-94 [Tanacetum coccineum]
MEMETKTKPEYKKDNVVAVTSFCIGNHDAFTELYSEMNHEERIFVRVLNSLLFAGCVDGFALFHGKNKDLDAKLERFDYSKESIWVWSGKDVSYRYLRVFGCKASVYILKDERSKLDVKGKPCVFLGYGQDEFGYRLYDPVQKKLVRSRVVVFEEDQTLKDVENAERETIPQYNDDLIDLDPVPPKHFDSQFGDDI